MAGKAALFGGIFLIVGWFGMTFIVPPIAEKVFDKIVCPSYGPGEAEYYRPSCLDGVDEVTTKDSVLLGVSVLFIAIGPAFMLPLAYNKRRQWKGVALGLFVGLYYGSFCLLIILG